MNGEDYKKIIIEMLKKLNDEAALIKIYTMVEFLLEEEQGRE